MGALDGVDLAGVGPWTVEAVASTGSTNADLAERARAGVPAWTAMVAGEQTGGRGRLTRTWSSPSGTSVSLSVLLRPSRPVSEWGLLPLLTGLGVARGLAALGVDAVLKWPNDVLLPADDERKVCGILAELVATPTPSVVIGMGINVGQQRDELPVDTATSLRLVGVDATRPQVVSAVLTELGDVYGTWASYGWAALQDAYTSACVTLGRTVRVEVPDGEAVLGTAASITPDGRIVVRTREGERAFAAGDVHHLRAL
ncbi:MAG TPA: biotin--[acetyl-CoA-carboxylase] ligase [Propionibacteriaceae bacterium]|nr:biotin--[acetyl-CoA-carboxylase] ligase [Propionibacteriaceae bacterium]